MTTKKEPGATVDYRTKRRNGLLVLEINGSGDNNGVIDEPALEKISTELRQHIREFNPLQVVLDMSSISYLGGTFMEELFKIRKGRDLSLAGVTPLVLELFDVTNTTQIFKASPDSVDVVLGQMRQSLGGGRG